MYSLRSAALFQGAEIALPLISWLEQNLLRLEFLSWQECLPIIAGKGCRKKGRGPPAFLPCEWRHGVILVLAGSILKGKSPCSRSGARRPVFCAGPAALTICCCEPFPDLTVGATCCRRCAAELVRCFPGLQSARRSVSGMWMTVRAQQSQARVPREAFQVM